MQTHLITVGGLTFTVDITGADNAPPVLFLHGFPQTRHMWRHQLEGLAGAGFRAIAPDQRGYSSGARPAELEAYATVCTGLTFNRCRVRHPGEDLIRWPLWASLAAAAR